ncbi:LysR substrate-binding domain-containing protein [Amphritea sp.]|uniref:LysR substrate-binding domain-containing protein n=1 Tax=Amphritea sp. TaxID=1872502 RepID=UPI003A934027
MQINLNTLRIFDAAARHLNFRLAAAELCLTQGAVAQRIRKLEQDIGIKLFARHARGVTFTPKGEAYHQSIRQALSLINKATDELTGQRQRLAISAPPSVVTKWLMPRVAAFSQRYPDINVSIAASEDLTNFSMEDVDLAIRLGSPPSEPKLNHQQLSGMVLYAVCAPQRLSREEQPVDLADFADHRLIEDSHHSWSRLLGHTPRQVLTLSHSYLAIDAAVNGQGIALVPGFLLEEELALQKLTVLRKIEGKDQEGLHIVWPASEENHNSYRGVLIDWLNNHGTSLT